jgi:hypothetical protein
MKRPIAVADPVAIAMGSPTRRLLLECLPVFVARVPVPQFGGVHDPWKPVGVGWSAVDHVGANVERQRLEFSDVQTVLEREKWLVASDSSATTTKLFEVAP